MKSEESMTARLASTAPYQHPADDAEEDAAFVERKMALSHQRLAAVIRQGEARLEAEAKRQEAMVNDSKERGFHARARHRVAEINAAESAHRAAIDRVAAALAAARETK